ncbi:MAG: hypothetical protein LBH24_00940 [Clostridiales bacterium]|jgi:hypothetical protein|nr:hypothetical protein [Clostridiales bacterium]
MGDVKAKRKAFLDARASNRLCLDNDEILAVYPKDGKTYFVEGEIPFAAMSVAEYVAYSKSLIRKVPVRDRETAYYLKLFRTGLSPSNRMKRLTTVEYRSVQLVAGYDLSVTALYINMDGYLYTRRNARALERMLKSLSRFFKLHVAVTDFRFMKNAETVVCYAPDGNTTTLTLKGFVSEKTKKHGFLSMAAGSGLGLEQMTIRRVVAAGNEKTSA